MSAFDPLRTLANYFAGGSSSSSRPVVANSIADRLATQPVSGGAEGFARNAVAIPRVQSSTGMGP